MKITISILILFLSTLSFSQSWTTEEKAVLTKYNLSENDHRGIILTADGNSCDVEVDSQLEAIESFFTPDVRKDLITVCISGEAKDYYNKPLGLKEVIDIYLSILNN